MSSLLASWITSDAFLNATRSWMLAHNATEFSMCEDATLGEGAHIQGFVPCPYPSHGVGTWENPGGACQPGSSDSFFSGWQLLSSFVTLVSLFVIFLMGRKKYKWATAKRRKKYTTFDQLSDMNLVFAALNCIYVIDTDGSKGWYSYAVASAIGLSCLFVLLQMFFMCECAEK